MAREIPEEARELLGEQHGVLSRAQALRSGLTDKQIVAALRRGHWQRLHTGVFAVFSGEPGRAATLWAAVLRAGPNAVLSHDTAAELHGLAATRATAIHITVPSGQWVTPISGVVLHYSCRVAEVRHPVRTPPQTRIEETVLDLVGAAATLDDALGWIFRACGSRKTTPERLGAALALRPRMRWRTELAGALGLGATGVHSLLEFRYVARVERPHGLPSGSRQRPVQHAGTRQYQDVSYDSYGVAVELDGRAAHPAERRWGDIRRDNANAAQGQLTLRYGWADVTGRPCLVAAEVATVLGQRGWTATPRRCGPGCALPG